MATPVLFEVLPAGFLYRPDFVSADEERVLIEELGRMEFGDVKIRGVTARRRVRQFGWRYSFESFRVTPGSELPEFLVRLRDRAASLAGVDAAALSEALVTEYREGAAIGWHRDAPQYDIVAGISLLSSCRMKFRPYIRPKEQTSIPGRRRIATHEIGLERRSAYLMTGESRNAYEHHIPAVPALRYSITFRTVRS